MDIYGDVLFNFEINSNCKTIFQQKKNKHFGKMHQNKKSQKKNLILNHHWQTRDIFSIISNCNKIVFLSKTQMENTIESLKIIKLN